MAANENFRKNLRTAIESRGLTQKSVAERAGTQAPYVNSVLQGNVCPSLDQCEKLARAAGFPLMALLDAPENFSSSVLTGVN